MNDTQLMSFQRAGEIFNSELMKGGEPTICKLHEIFDSMRDNSSTHNCLGCNFANSIYLIKSFFNRIEHYDTLDDAYFEYLFRLYLVIERMNEIFKIIELPLRYKSRHFNIVQEVTKWANFIKHPKAFVYTHHPVFMIEGESTDSDCTTIDSEFVCKYYSNEKKNKKLFDKVHNNPSIVVQFPNPCGLMEGFISEFDKFQDIISNNKVYKEILSECSTYEEYFEEMDE